MDLQKMVDAISEMGELERSRYHATFGDLIDKLKKADNSSRISPVIKGIGAYRGYYSDIALCIQQGSDAFKTAPDYDSPTEGWNKWYEENTIKIEWTENPKELATILESLVGKYFDGYKGGFNKITREKPLWLASDYGDCSCLAVVDITDDLKLITREIDF